MGAYTFADPVSGAPSFTGKIFRSLLSVFAGVKTGARPVGGRSGVTVGIPSTIVSVSMPTYTVTPFCGYLDTSAGSADGGTPFEFDTNQTGTVTAAHATLERIDLLFVRLDDPSEGDGTANPLPVVGYLAGTAASAGSQVAPATPARAFPLAQINVPHSGAGSPTVTWVAPWVVAAGGVLPVSSQAVRDALTKYAGLTVYRLDFQRLEVWNGSAWDSTNDSRRLAGTSRTTNSAAVGAEATLTVNVSFTLTETRRVRYSFGGYLTGSASTTSCRLTLRRNNTGAAIATGDTRVNFAEAPTGTLSGTTSRVDTELLTAGTYGYGLTVGSLGGGTAQLLAASDYPCTLEIFDAGPT